MPLDTRQIGQHLSGWLAGHLKLEVVGTRQAKWIRQGTPQRSSDGLFELSGQRQLSPSLDDAARTFGATYLQRLVGIQLPALRRFTAGAWLLAFVFCLRDIETTALLYPAGGEPLTVRLFTLEANGPPAVVAAFAVVLALLTIVPLAAAALALRTPR